MKTTRGQSLKGLMQKGFTLVELAIVLVIAGIILVGVLKGTDSINKAKVERMVADLKGLQGSILEFQKRNSRLPGDCNNNGVIELAVSAVAAKGVDNILDKTVRDPSTLAVCGTPGAGTSPPSPSILDDMANTNLGGGSSAKDAFNLPWNELRRSGVVDGNRTNEELGRHMFNDIYVISSMATAADGTGPNANVIVVYGIPVWMAEAIDAEMDGVATSYGDATQTGPACTGRVRMWSKKGTAGEDVTEPTTLPGDKTHTVSSVFNGTTCVGQYGTDRDAIVSISYQFDTMKLPK